MTTENTSEISKLLRRCVAYFGRPLAVVRDLSKNIENAKKEVLADVPDLICQYHFLENVGNQLCEKPHAQLTNALRRLKIRPALSSLRKDLVRWSRKGNPLSASQIDHLLAHPEQIAELDAVALRRFVAYVLLRWVEDFGADLRGEYFPFDLPSLAFYRRGLRLGEWVSELFAADNFLQREFPTLQTTARHLAALAKIPRSSRRHSVWRKPGRCSRNCTDLAIKQPAARAIASRRPHERSPRGSREPAQAAQAME